MQDGAKRSLKSCDQIKVKCSQRQDKEADDPHHSALAEIFTEGMIKCFRYRGNIPFRHFHTGIIKCGKRGTNGDYRNTKDQKTQIQDDKISEPAEEAP